MTPTKASSKTKVAIRGGENFGAGEEKEGVTSGFGGRFVWDGVEIFGFSI